MKRKTEMTRYLSIAGQWCRAHRKIVVCLFVLFILLSCSLMDFVYVLARSSCVPPITVRAIDIDTRQPICDALVAVVYYTGILNETSVAVENRITNDSGVAEFPARMIWAHWLAPDVYTGAKITFQHYYYVKENVSPSWIVRNSPYLSSPVSIEIEGRHIDKLSESWADKLYHNLKVTFFRMPIYYELSNGPRESTEQIIRHYENTFSNHAIYGVSAGMERDFRDKITELRTWRMSNEH